MLLFQIFLYFTFQHLLVYISIQSLFIFLVDGRGVAVFGGKTPPPNGSVAKKLDTGQHLIWAVFGFASVVLIFLSICFCRCYYRYKEMTSSNKQHSSSKRSHRKYLKVNDNILLSNEA